MNKFLQKVHRLLGCDIVKNLRAEALKTKVMREKRKDIRELKKTNGAIRVIIERGEIELKIVK